MLCLKIFDNFISFIIALSTIAILIAINNNKISQILLAQNHYIRIPEDNLNFLKHVSQNYSNTIFKLFTLCLRHS